MTTLVGDAGPVVSGERVLLHDGDSEALGIVTDADDDLITARIDWATWGPAGRYYVTVDGWLIGTTYENLTHIAADVVNDVPTKSEDAVAIPWRGEPVAA